MKFATPESSEREKNRGKKRDEGFRVEHGRVRSRVFGSLSPTRTHARTDARKILIGREFIIGRSATARITAYDAITFLPSMSVTLLINASCSVWIFWEKGNARSVSRINLIG